MPAQSKVNVDLMPPDLRARENAQERVGGWAGVLIAVAVALLIVGLALRLQIRRNNAALEPLRLRVAELHAIEPKAIRILADINTLSKTMAGASTLLQEPDWNALVNDVASAAPPSMWVAQCDMRQPLGTNQNETPRLTVMGSAAEEQDIATFVSNLSASPRLTDLRVQVGMGTAPANGDAVEFTVTARIIPSAEAAP